MERTVVASPLGGALEHQVLHLFHSSFREAVARRVVGGGDLVRDVQSREEVREFRAGELGSAVGTDAIGEAELPEDRVQPPDDSRGGHGVELADDGEAGVSVNQHEPVLPPAVEDVGAQRLHGERGGWGGGCGGGSVGGAEGLAGLALRDQVVDVGGHAGPEVELAGRLRRLGDPSVGGVEEGEDGGVGAHGDDNLVAAEHQDLVLGLQLQGAEVVPHAEVVVEGALRASGALL